MQNGRINYRKLDLACPQAKTEIEKHVHMLREIGVDKKYRHRSIMYIIITTTNFIIELLTYNFIINFSRISKNSSQHRSIVHKLY